MTTTPTRRRRWLRNSLLGVLALVLLAGAGAGTLYLLMREAMGSKSEGARLARMQRSPQWGSTGRFRNRLPRHEDISMAPMREFLFGGSAHRRPDEAIPVVRRSSADYGAPPASGLRVTWLGHSTLLLELGGRRVLIDPVWGERASPLTFAGPKRFFAPPLPLAELPPVDAVVISHDHYDHLDMPTVKALGARNVRWIVPLGVGAHLESWGIAATSISELDWWDAVQVRGITITATPARHFSGRGMDDDNHTLWAGWAFSSTAADGTGHRVFYSGDTALHDEFVEIGRRLGPFDLTMIESGAYDAYWPDVHLGPEQAVLAHRLVRGDVMLPVHWGLFNLALHGWTEPMERVMVAADSQRVRIATPRPGGMVEPATLGPPERWWPRVPWKTVAEAPAWSTGVEHLRDAARAP